MTAIFLSDTFYLIDNMSMDEVIGIASSEGLNSPKIRAKAVMHFNTEFYSSTRIKEFLSSISIGFYETGNSFIMKPIRELADLDYFVGPDGRKYTCAEEYHDSPYRFVGNNQEVRNASMVELESLSESSEQDKDATAIIVPRVASVPELEPISTVYVPPQLPPASVELVSDIPLTDNAIDIQEAIEHAEFLDGFLSKYPHISLYVKGPALTEVEDYLGECAEDLYREVKKPFLEDAKVLNIVNGDLGELVVDNAVGSSNNMLDSLLTFPVFSAIIGKKKLTDRFVALGLPGSQFIRICPVGVSENGELHGFVHMEEITNAAAQRAESEIRAMLKSRGESLNKLSAQDKYKLFEEKLASYYAKSSGKMLRASGSQKYVNIVEFLNNMGKKKYVIPDVYDEAEGMILWPTHETITFDNRGSKKLKEQIEEQYTAQQDALATTSGDDLEADAKFIQTDSQVEEGYRIPSVIPLPASTSNTQQHSVDLESIVTTSLPNGDDYEVDDTVQLGDASDNRRKVQPTHTPRVIHLPGEIDEVAATMGGIDPLNPTEYVDSGDRRWKSKEDYERIRRAIFGDSDENLGVKKK